MNELLQDVRSVVDENGVRWYCLTDFGKAANYTKPKSLSRNRPKHNFKFFVTKNNQKAKFTTLDVLESILSRSNKTDMTAGFVYALVIRWRPDKHHKIVKIGRTTDWDKRCNAYVLGNTPDPILFVKKVSHQYETEQKIVSYMNRRYAIAHGKEYFIVPRGINNESLKSELLTMI